eukprot:CAMPEP_0196586270 /NCGR_PEP_ID=MMETSP1081-20130531/53689_1 /TAXON_ID=36882 /ORGANISM="Pyramimonas amylifera, Strain CCMP720" /LENGTH=300 /DNA_ID=CAMNT_0041908089 /DNA_START=176 /DNA_END=1078 /DNA_ORIENTATION=-
MAVAPIGEQVVAILAGSDGRLTRVRLTTPEASGISTDHIQVECLAGGGMRSGRQLASWTSEPIHGGACVAVDILPDTLDVVCAGADGSVVVVSAHDAGAPQPQVLCEASSNTEGIRTVNWISHHTFVTAGMGSGLHVWDRRQPRTKTQSHQLHYHPSPKASRIQCVDVLRSRPHICASGAENGVVSLWDLRHLNTVVRSETLESQSPVWEVHFDAFGNFTPADDTTGGSLPGIMACSESGELALVANIDTSTPCVVYLFNDLSAINSFHLDPTTGQDILCCTETEEYVHIRQTDKQTSLL